eukprot:136220_1
MKSLSQQILLALVVLSTYILVNYAYTVSWLGTAPFCSASRMRNTCETSNGYVAMYHKEGDGKRCSTGLKTCCCYGNWEGYENACVHECYLLLN